MYFSPDLSFRRWLVFAGNPSFALNLFDPDSVSGPFVGLFYPAVAAVFVPLLSSARREAGSALGQWETSATR